MAGTARENLFPAALAHVDQHGVQLEERSNVLWSSQALCISVFGTVAESPRRAQLMQHILEAGQIELRTLGEPELTCEVRGRRDVLNEIGGSNATCPDVLVEWPEVTMTIESKFSEHLGPCGQIQLRRRGANVAIDPKACIGNYETGSDLRTRKDAACRLTIAENEGRRGYRSPRRYWEVGQRLFKEEILTPPRRPCPFADGKYQLMRNLCFVAALAEQHPPGRDYGFLLSYVGAAASASESARDFAAFRAMLLSHVAPRVGAITYERIAGILRADGEGDLAVWVDERLREGVSARNR